MKRHYIAGSGSFGCLYDQSQAFTNFKAACDFLTDLFEIVGTRKAGQLRRHHIVELGPEFGADYAEITICDCGNAREHLDRDY